MSPVNTIIASKWVDLRHSLLQKLVADFYTIMQIIISLLGKVYNHTPIIKHLSDFPDKKRFKELQLKMHFFLLHHYSFFYHSHQFSESNAFDFYFLRFREVKRLLQNFFINMKTFDTKFSLFCGLLEWTDLPNKILKSFFRHGDLIYP